MKKDPHLAALVVISMAALAAPTFVVQPGTPRDPMIPPARSQPAVPKSDEHRIVGKVLHIDREQGRVKLETEEGVVVVPAPMPTLRAIYVGDVVSVPRSVDESPSASPRQ